MNLVKSLIKHLKNKQSNPESSAPEGVCPNCWGHSEYGGKFYETVVNHGFDVNSKDPQIGWIQEYADKHLTGLQLVKKDESMICEKCKITYKSDS